MPGQDTPNLTAGGSINTFSCVHLTTTDNTGVQAGAGEQVVGISDGSPIDAFDEDHAESGDPIRLQPGTIKRVRCGGTVAAGALVASDANGDIVTFAIASHDNYVGTTLQGGADGDIVRIKFHPGQNTS